jgi:atlastin
MIFFYFLQIQFSSVKNPGKPAKTSFKYNAGWMGSPYESLKGFSWKAGSTRVTSGITMWNDVFLHTLNGEEIAIVVMDTQGLFDNETTEQDNSKIFSLGTLLSSIQVLNLSRQIQEDQLNYLRFATEFASFTGIESDKTSGEPFQQLTILIRDWSCPFEYEYGIKGGNEYLKKVLSTPGRNEKLQSVRESITSSFEKINSCLLPNPGNSVTSVEDYNGCWSDMDPKFRGELQVFIEHLLHPDNLVLKKINSKELTCGEMKTYAEMYFNLLISSGVLRAQNVYEATIENVMRTIIEKCISEYEELIELKDDPDVDPKWITTIHHECKAKAMNIYRKEKKMGTINHDRKFEGILEDHIEEIYENWSKHKIEIAKKNEEKKEAEKRAQEAEREAQNIKEQSEAKIKISEELARAEREKNEILERENARISESLRAQRIQTAMACFATTAGAVAKVFKYIPK